MGTIVRKYLKLLLRSTAKAGIVWPLVALYRIIIKEEKPTGGNVPLGKPTILVLQQHRFGSNLKCLVDSMQFRVLILPMQWQSILLAIFWPSQSSLVKHTRVDYFHPERDKQLSTMQAELRTFLKRFLVQLCNKLNIDCVIGACAQYVRDYDIGLVSNEIGVPYIVFHRENIYMPTALKSLECVYRNMGRFVGSHIIVHNEDMKNVLIRTGFIDEANVSVLGCLRMDDFVRQVRSLDSSIHCAVEPSNRKKVTLFSFTHAVSIDVTLGGEVVGVDKTEMPDGHFTKKHGKGFKMLFEHVHVSIAQLAVQNKDVDFVIKPKWGGSWIDEIEHALIKNNLDISNINNLHILPDIDAHDLILRSDVICGFSSTTLLESAIAGKLVIIPYFDEALKKEYTDFVEFKDSFHLFNVAHSVKEFDKLIVECLRNPIKISESQMNGRYAIFEKYVSSMSGSALDKYAETVNNIIKT